MARSGRSRIPVVVVYGFLGAGKTTMLNHLLRHNRGVRIGVVVNDFGSVNIDAMVVAGQVDSLMSLSNGCLCCAVDVTEMDAMFTTLADASPPLDVIVVEASGVAEPRAMMRLVLGSAESRIVYGGSVCVVDGVEFERTRRIHPEIDRHVRLADLILLSKVDRLTDAAMQAISESLSTVAEDTPVVPTENGRVDAGLLFDLPDRRPDDDVPRQLSLDEVLYPDSDDHSDHLHAAYRAATLSVSDPVDPRRLVDFLGSPGGNVYRIKGFVHFGIEGYDERYRVDTVGRHVRLEADSWSGDSPTTELVMIGAALDEEFLEVRLLDCVRRTGDDVTAKAMLPVHRFVD